MARQRLKGGASPLDGQQILGNALALDQSILGQLRGLGGGQGGGLVIADDGTVTVGAFRLTGKGLIAQDGAPVEQWTQLLKVLALMHGKIQMLIGDALAYGERQYGETYKEVAAIFGRQVKTMYEWKYVCASVDLSIRMEKSHFGHLQLVASLDPAQQAHWLRLAAANDWTVAQLREAIKPTPDRQLVLSSDDQKALQLVRNMTPESLTDPYHRQSNRRAIARVRELLDRLEAQFDQLEDELNG